MTSYLRYVVCMSLGAHLSMASGYDVVRDLNEARMHMYNEPLSLCVNPEDPMELAKLDENSVLIYKKMTMNVESSGSKKEETKEKKKVGASRRATEAERKLGLQVIFATEIIYGDKRSSYLESVSTTDDIYTHCYVLEYSSLLARQFGIYGLDPVKGGTPEFKKLYTLFGYPQSTLYEWFTETKELYQAGLQARWERRIALIMQQSPSLYAWEGTYLLNDGQSRVIHTPTGVQLDELSHVRVIDVQGSFYKTICLNDGLTLETDVSQEDFVNALIRSGAYEGTEEERRWYEASGHWVHTFTLRDGTRIRHTPSTLVIFPETEDEESIEDICATEINRMRFKGMLRLHTKSSFTEFVRALKKANAIL